MVYVPTGSIAKERSIFFDLKHMDKLTDLVNSGSFSADSKIKSEASGNIRKRNNPVPKTIRAILTVDDLSSSSKVEAKDKIPISNITQEIKRPEILVRLAISGCEDANIVASIA